MAAARRWVFASLLIGTLGSTPGCSDIVSQYQAATATSGGAQPLSADIASPDAALAESLAKCDTYRRSLSVTQRQGGASLALLAAASGALGLAFVPAGAATVSGFTAGSTILAAASAQWSGTTYYGLSAQDISRRFNHYYTDAMNDLTKEGQFTIARVRTLHSRCSLEYMAAQPSPP